MKKLSIFLVMLTAVLSLAACGNASGKEAQPVQTEAPAETVAETVQATQPSANVLNVRFGGNGPVYQLHLENNTTAAAVYAHVGSSEWRLPVYSYDESEVMEYYDIPSRYEIPDNSVTVTEAHTGEAYYSHPNRIILYYHDAQINEQYTLIGKFDVDDQFVDAVENNPVLEGWGNQIVEISR